MQFTFFCNDVLFEVSRASHRWGIGAAARAVRGQAWQRHTDRHNSSSSTQLGATATRGQAQ